MYRGPHAGMESMDGWGMKVFTEDQLEKIHISTLDVLKNCGITVGSEQAREIFAQGGASVDDNEMRVKIPPHMVEDAIQSAPKSILLAGRNSEHDMTVENGRVGFVNFGKGVKVIDPYTGEHRDSTMEDFKNTLIACDAMENVNMYLEAVEPTDIPEDLAKGLLEAEAMFTNISKHFLLGDFFWGIEGFRRFIKMAEIVAGGPEKLRERPIVSTGGCPSSPLELGEQLCDLSIEGAKAGIPVMILSMAMSGATAPMTLAGTLVTHNAEVLSGLVLLQLVNRGNPFIYGSSTTAMDMTYATSPVGSPELAMVSAGATALSRYYLLPSFIAGG